MFRRVLTIAALPLTASAAQTPPATGPAACATPAAPPAALAGWTAMKPLNASDSAATATVVPIGTGIRATLLPTPDVRYARRPEKPGGPVSKGGVFAFEVPRAGRYRVALGSGAWVDVVRDGRAMASVAHGHGPECTGIRKMVDFDLTAGRHLLQVAGNGSATLSMMVARLGG